MLRSRTLEDRFFEHDWVVKPGHDPSAIRVRWEGVQSVNTDEQGRLLLSVNGRTVIQDAPTRYAGLGWLAFGFIAYAIYRRHLGAPLASTARSRTMVPS